MEVDEQAGDFHMVLICMRVPSVPLDMTDLRSVNVHMEIILCLSEPFSFSSV